MTGTGSAQPLLAVKDIEIFYETSILAVQGVSLQVASGEIVALLGANGAGKTSTLRAISNLLPAQRGRLSRGRISVDGRSTAGQAASRLVAAGVVQVLENRHCFKSLTIEENLRAGALGRGSSRAETRADLERVYDLFPRLRARSKVAAGLTSGGEQQMTAIGRALMGRPRLLILDEPTIGLAPIVVVEIFQALVRLNREEGLSILLAEQNAAFALRAAHRGIVLETGRVVLEGPPEMLRSRDAISAAYLGVEQRPASERCPAA